MSILFFVHKKGHPIARFRFRTLASSSSNGASGGAPARTRMISNVMKRLVVDVATMKKPSWIETFQAKDAITASARRIRPSNPTTWYDPPSFLQALSCAKHALESETFASASSWHRKKKRIARMEKVCVCLLVFVRLQSCHALIFARETNGGPS